MPYIGTSPSNGVRRVFDYTATAGQTSFSGSDNNSQTLAYTDSAYIDVYQNGILLIPSDYTATTGTTVVLDTGATVSDTVQIVAYDVFSVADTVSASDGGSFGGNVGVGGNLTTSGTYTGGGLMTTGGNIIIPDAGNIGSASDTDAMSISSGGVVTLSASSQRAQCFRLAANEAGDGAAQRLTNFEEADTDYTRVGAANWTHSSGVFSSATTGTFLCMYNLTVATTTTDGFDARIRISTDSGSNYSTRALTFTYAPDNYGAISNQFIFTVSNTTTFRLDFYCGATNSIATASTIQGDSNYTATGITFVKLGVI